MIIYIYDYIYMIIYVFIYKKYKKYIVLYLFAPIIPLITNKPKKRAAMARGFLGAGEQGQASTLHGFLGSRQFTSKKFPS